MRVVITDEESGKKLDMTGAKEIELMSGLVFAIVNPKPKGFELVVSIGGKGFATYEFPCTCDACIEADMPGSREAKDA